jgi:hypothetical protein
VVRWVHVCDDGGGGGDDDVLNLNLTLTSSTNMNETYRDHDQHHLLIDQVQGHCAFAVVYVT